MIGVPARRIVTTLLAALVAGGCASMSVAPIGKGDSSFQLEADERRIWSRAEEEERRLDASGFLHHDAELEAYLNGVLDRLVPAGVSREQLPLRVRVLRNPLLSAFTYPNGVIYVHTGILARMDNEAQLATLLAHELTHATHRHAVTQFRDVQNKTAFVATVGVLGAPFGAIGALVQLIGGVGAMAAIYGYSQEQEGEADREGLALMARAGYDAREAPKLFAHLKRWVQDEKKPEPFFFGTHPRLAERIASYESLLATEFSSAGNDAGRVGDAEFLRRTTALILDNAALDLQAGRFAQTQKGVRKYVTLSPNHAQAYYLLGESHRRTNDPKQREEAMGHYRKAIAVDARFADAYRGLGTLHYQAGDRSAARDAFARYLELAPDAKDRAYIKQILDELAGGGKTS